jgi:hypothetical protein
MIKTIFLLLFTSVYLFSNNINMNQTRTNFDFDYFKKKEINSKNYTYIKNNTFDFDFLRHNNYKKQNFKYAGYNGEFKINYHYNYNVLKKNIQFLNLSISTHLFNIDNNSLYDSIYKNIFNSNSNYNSINISYKIVF